MTRVWSRWVELFGRTEDGLTLALVRIVVGFAVASHLLRLLAVGAPSLIWVDSSVGGFRGLSPPWLASVGGATPDNIQIIVVGTAVAAVSLALGSGTRVSCFLTWLGFRFLDDMNSHAGGAYGALLVNTLFLLLLSGCGARLSVDARLAGGARPVTAWPRWLMVFQLAVMYFSTALQKLSDHWVPWGTHDALWYILQQPTWQRVPMEWVAPAAWVLSLSTLVVWAFELLSPLLLLTFWFRLTRERPGALRALFNRLDVRLLYLALGFAMHLGIELTMEVGAFFPATMALYVAAIAPDEWRLGGRVVRRALRVRIGGRPSTG